MATLNNTANTITVLETELRVFGEKVELLVYLTNYVENAIKSLVYYVYKGFDNISYISDTRHAAHLDAILNTIFRNGLMNIKENVSLIRSGYGDALNFLKKVTSMHNNVLVYNNALAYNNMLAYNNILAYVSSVKRVKLFLEKYDALMNSFSNEYENISIGYFVAKTTKAVFFSMSIEDILKIAKTDTQ